MSIVAPFSARSLVRAALLGGLWAASSAAAGAATPSDLPDAAALPTIGITQAAAPAAVKPAPRHARHRAIETVDTASLATQAASVPALSGAGAGVPAASSLVIEARAQMMRPAPLPDQDVDAPGPDARALAAQQEASLAPSVYAQTDHFAGDGYASGSTLESNQNNRRKPGGGMSLSIPVP